MLLRILMALLLDLTATLPDPSFALQHGLRGNTVRAAPRVLACEGDIRVLPKAVPYQGGAQAQQPASDSSDCPLD